MLDILLLIVGLGLILGGANYLTDGASALAQRLRMPDFLIGLTIVAIGTSMPEMVVSVMSAINGQPDMSIGNVVGSNLFNVLVILGVCAAIRPLSFSKNTVLLDIPFGVAAAFLLMVMALDTVFEFGPVNSLSRVDGIIMLCLYIGLMIYTIRVAERPAEGDSTEKPMAVWLMAVMIIGGLCGLIFGGNLFLDSATNIARSLGVSESVIAITLVAGGTSLPELASSVVSLIKGKADMALGNVIGSNIANILLILGLSATITPLSLGGITPFDLMMVVLSAMLVFATSITFRRNRLDRPEGVIFLVIYTLYIYRLIA